MPEIKLLVICNGNGPAKQANVEKEKLNGERIKGKEGNN